MQMFRLFFASWVALLLSPAFVGIGNAQSKGLQSGLGAFGLGGASDVPCIYDATYELEKGSNRGTLKVTATPDEGYHTFSVTQSAGPAKTAIKLKDKAIQLGTFVPDTPPHTSTTELGFEGIRVEMHEGSVTWTASMELPAPLEKPGDLELAITAQVCTSGPKGGRCVPIQESIPAVFTGYYEAATSNAQLGAFREEGSLSEWSVKLSHSKAKRGDTVDLIIEGVPDQDFHLYIYDGNDQQTENRTLIVLKQKAGMKASKPLVDRPVVHKNLGGGIQVDYYEGPVVYRVPLKVPVDAIPDRYAISGLVGYQACNENQCDQPRGFEFRTEILISENESDNSPVFAAIKALPFKEIAQIPKRNKWIDEVRVALTMSFSEILAKFSLAMVGGLVLNFMPCVLPVIGLKILGFVTESAGDRSSASRLTLVYALGIITLIFGLGLLSVGVRQFTGQAYGWGEQFGSIGFRIITTSFMFALALSFLGVWDIPIPGFATGGKSVELAGREGYLGAFFKGVITTILATPCSAPFLGSVFVVALSQPSWVVLVIFFGVGLGMALPYLLISLQPGLLGFIPKPGPWMETFKEFLAFPMLLAVVMFVNGFSGDQKIAMLGSLIFVWFACWLIGRVPAWESIGPRLTSWSIGILVAFAGTAGSFYAMSPSPYQMAWKPYKEETLDQLVGDGNTVLIDFTAEWCQNCKLNLNTAIQTKKVKELVDKYGVVTMEADMTDYPPHVKEKLNSLDSNSIPVLAIYRPGDTENPIVLRDVLGEKDVLDALKEAGPSKKADTASAKQTSASAAQPKNVQ